jgi:elongation factor G
LPIGTGETFTGLIDLITMKAITYEETSLGSDFFEGDIPEDLQSTALEYRESLVEAVAEFDDQLLEKFLEGGEIGDDELIAALRKATIAQKAVPVCCGSAFKHKGVQRLLDSVISYLPSPADVPPVTGHLPKSEEEAVREAKDEEPFSALAFKIMTDPFVGRQSIQAPLRRARTSLMCPLAGESVFRVCLRCMLITGRNGKMCTQAILSLSWV